MHHRRPRGFSLIEVLVAVVILAAAALMTGQFASTSVGRGASGTISFETETTLRNAIEDITIYYRGQLNAGTLTLPNVVNTVNTRYAALVNGPLTGYLSFSDADGDKVYSPSTITDTHSAGLILLVTLTSDNQSLCALFTE